MKHSNVLVLGMVSAAAVLSCGKKKSEVQDQINTALDNALAIGYPDGLSIPNFPKTTTTSSLNDSGTLGIDATGATGETVAQKEAEAKKILGGNVDDCFANLKTRAKRALPDIDSCYEFDQEMIYGWRDNANQLKGTKSGLSNKSGSTEVCMVSFARDEMKEIEAMVDQALDRAQVMACLGKKAGKNPPANVGDVVDLRAEIAGKASQDPEAPVFSEVTLKRLDDKDSRPVFETKIVTSRGDQSEEVSIVHSPKSTSDNSSYDGVIKVKRTGGPSKDPNATGMVHAVSINYARSEEEGVKKIKASVRRGRFKSTYTNLFDADGRVDFSILPDNATNSDVNGIGMVEFDLNRTDETGTLSYWRNPGGNYNEMARGFVFKIEKESGSELKKGCSVSGAVRGADMGNGVSIRKSLKEGVELKPNGWYHPFFFLELIPNSNPPQKEAANPDANFDYNINRQSRDIKWSKPAIGEQTLAAKYVEDQTGNHVTRQCFKQDASGNYVLDNSEISGSAGYELIETNSPDFIAPPNLAAVRDRKLK